MLAVLEDTHLCTSTTIGKHGAQTEQSRGQIVQTFRRSLLPSEKALCNDRADCID
jgi:hypothetical protein